MVSARSCALIPVVVDDIPEFREFRRQPRISALDAIGSDERDPDPRETALTALAFYETVRSGSPDGARDRIQALLTGDMSASHLIFGLLMIIDALLCHTDDQAELIKHIREGLVQAP